MSGADSLCYRVAMGGRPQPVAPNQMATLVMVADTATGALAALPASMPGATIGRATVPLHALSASFWSALYKRPYGLTDASTVLSRGALERLLDVLVAPAPRDAELLVQYTADVVLVDTEEGEDANRRRGSYSPRAPDATNGATAVACARAAAFKRTLGRHRLLLLTPDVVLYQAGGSGGASSGAPITGVVLAPVIAAEDGSAAGSAAAAGGTPALSAATVAQVAAHQVTGVRGIVVANEGRSLAEPPAVTPMSTALAAGGASA
jgi:hypothetical protein